MYSSACGFYVVFLKTSASHSNTARRKSVPCYRVFQSAISSDNGPGFASLSGVVKPPGTFGDQPHVKDEKQSGQ